MLEDVINPDLLQHSMKNNAVSYHETVCEVCRGGAWLKGLLGGCRQRSVVDGTQRHRRRSRRPPSATRVIVIIKLVLTKLYGCSI